VIGFGGNPVHRSVGYAAPKGALNNLTRHLATEWARFGIYVNALAPAYFPTEMTVDPRIGTVPPDHEAIIVQFTPMQRLGRVEEIDTAVLFLASPASSYVTGSIVTVDGGVDGVVSWGAGERERPGTDPDCKHRVKLATRVGSFMTLSAPVPMTREVEVNPARIGAGATESTLGHRDPAQSWRAEVEAAVLACELSTGASRGRREVSDGPRPAANSLHRDRTTPAGALRVRLLGAREEKSPVQLAARRVSPHRFESDSALPQLEYRDSPSQSLGERIPRMPRARSWPFAR
jgi:Enoyl-(Acyl carrier protein) reductase